MSLYYIMISEEDDDHDLYNEYDKQFNTDHPV